MYVCMYVHPKQSPLLASRCVLLAVFRLFFSHSSMGTNVARSSVSPSSSPRRDFFAGIIQRASFSLQRRNQLLNAALRQHPQAEAEAEAEAITWSFRRPRVVDVSIRVFEICRSQPLIHSRSRLVRVLAATVLLLVCLFVCKYLCERSSCFF